MAMERAAHRVHRARVVRGVDSDVESSRIRRARPAAADLSIPQLQIASLESSAAAARARVPQLQAHTAAQNLATAMQSQRTSPEIYYYRYRYSVSISKRDYRYRYM